MEIFLCFYVSVSAIIILIRLDILYVYEIHSAAECTASLRLLNIMEEPQEQGTCARPWLCHFCLREEKVGSCVEDHEEQVCLFLLASRGWEMLEVTIIVAAGKDNCAKYLLIAHNSSFRDSSIAFQSFGSDKAGSLTIANSVPPAVCFPGMILLCFCL